MDFLNFSQPAFWVVVACGAVIVLSALPRQAKYFGKFAFRGAVGLLAVYLTNMAFGDIIGGAVGINALTMCVIGVLGAPGFALLYASGFFL